MVEIGLRLLKQGREMFEAAAKPDCARAKLSTNDSIAMRLSCREQLEHDCGQVDARPC